MNSQCLQHAVEPYALNRLISFTSQPCQTCPTAGQQTAQGTDGLEGHPGFSTSLPDHAPKRIKGRARTKRAVSRASRDAVSLGSSWLGLETQIGALFLKHLSPSSVCFKVEGTMGFLAKPTAQLCSLLLSQESCVPKLPCDTVCSAWNSWGGTEV